MSESKRVYLAGPDGFTLGGRKFHFEELIPVVEESGYEVLSPWEIDYSDEMDEIEEIDSFDDRKNAWGQLNERIAGKNEEMIREADAVVANLNGADIDSGTAAEVGFAYALGKPVLGLRTDFRSSGDNMGAEVNLQVENWTISICNTLEELREALKADLQEKISSN